MATRREFLGASVLAGALSAAGRSAQLKTIGVQLYTVRTVLPKAPAETLKAIHEIGYQEIEATFAGFDKIWPDVQASGLKPVSMHLDAKMVSQGGDDLSRAIDQLAKYGFKFGVFPYVNPADRGGPDVMKALAEKLNAAGEKCRAAGMACAYHNHAFEFESKDGTTLFQVLADNTDKKLVNFEMDLFWVSVAGNDPVEMLRKMKGRVPLVHLKDKAQGTPVLYKESVERTAFKEVGSGVLDWKKILAEAHSAGVQHYFVEQDQTPGDPLESLKKSYQYLSTLKY
jgi:sugar phosphate isomerase/epimerase